MGGLITGYVRVSTFLQKTDRQLDGVSLDKVFIDKASGKDNKRPELENLKQFVREGDTVIVHSMDRLARNLDDLRQTVRFFTDKGVKVHFLKENLIFSGEDSPLANLLLSVMGAFAEFERSLIRERQLEGIAVAKKHGVYTGRKPSLSEEDICEIRRRVAMGEKKAQIARDFNISRETLYLCLYSISNRCRQFIDKHGGPQKFAQKFNYNPDTIQQWYEGKRCPQQLSLRKLTHDFGIPESEWPSLRDKYTAVGSSPE